MHVTVYIWSRIQDNIIFLKTHFYRYIVTTAEIRVDKAIAT